VRTALSAILTKNFLKLLDFMVKPPFEVQSEIKIVLQIVHRSVSEQI